MKMITAVKKGFLFQSLVKLQVSMGLPLETVADALKIPTRTLSRRKLEGRLQPDESERVLRLSNLFDKAVALFDGNRAAATKWFRTPQRALGECPPLEYAKTEIGAREVEDLIGRLEHGVFT